MEERMEIRRYKDTDKEKLVALLRLNIPQYFASKEEQDFVDYLHHHIEYYYVVEIKGVIWGCGGFNLAEDGETAKISWDIFHPESQGKGLGTALTWFRIAQIKKMEGIKTISVRTSQMAYRFYAKFGLEIREIAKDFWDEGYDLYRMDIDICKLKESNPE